MKVWVVFVNHLIEAEVVGIYSNYNDAEAARVKAFEKHGPFIMVECKHMEIQ